MILVSISNYAMALFRSSKDTADGAQAVAILPPGLFGTVRLGCDRSEGRPRYAVFD